MVVAFGYFSLGITIPFLGVKPIYFLSIPFLSF